MNPPSARPRVSVTAISEVIPIATAISGPNTSSTSTTPTSSSFTPATPPNTLQLPLFTVTPRVNPPSQAPNTSTTQSTTQTSTPTVRSLFLFYLFI